MFYLLNDVLNTDELERLRTIARTAELADGSTSNPNTEIKKTRQVLSASEPGKEAGIIMRKALIRHPRFGSAALPKTIVNPRLVCYEAGAFYDDHVDLAIATTTPQIRTDVACTLFISDPSEYEGGELITHNGDRDMVFKAPAGSAVIYPASSVHRIRRVESGERIVGIGWIQSLIQDPVRREVLYKLDRVRRLSSRVEDRELAKAMGLDVGHLQGLLVRMWADV